MFVALLYAVTPDMPGRVCSAVHPSPRSGGVGPARPPPQLGKEAQPLELGLELGRQTPSLASLSSCGMLLLPSSLPFLPSLPHPPPSPERISHPLCGGALTFVSPAPTPHAAGSLPFQKILSCYLFGWCVSQAVVFCVPVSWNDREKEDMEG